MDLREYFANRRKEGEEPIIVTSEQLGEPFFKIYGPLLLEKGWSVYPQERSGRRLPARIEGEVIAWSQYQTERPSKAMGAKWSLHASTSNVAVIMGPSSGNAIALDVDVTDEELSVEIENLATTILGDTEYRRIGNAPKIMLFYRLAETATFNKRTLRLAVEDDPTVASEHMVEILAKNSTVTFYGRHHSTGARFKWLEHSAKISPEELPVITEAQLAEFEEALGKLRAIYKPRSAAFTMDIWSLPTATGHKRSIHPRNSADWIEDPVTGLVTDGREKYLHSLCFELIRANPSQRYAKEDHDDLLRIAFNTFTAKADRSGRWGRDDFLLREAGSRLNRAERGMEAGDISPNFNIVRRPDGAEVYEPPLPAAGASVFARMDDTGLEWLTSGKAFEPKHGRLKTSTANPADLLERQEQRMLVTDRGPISRDVSRACDKQADKLWRTIIANERKKADAERKRDRLQQEAAVNGRKVRPEKTDDAELEELEELETKLTILKAPTGSGKTSRMARRLTARIKARPDTLTGKKHITFIVRTYDNLRDLVAVFRDAGCEILDHLSPVPTTDSDPNHPRVAVWHGKKHTLILPAGGENVPGPCSRCPFSGQMEAMEKADIAPGIVCGEGKGRCSLWLNSRCTYYRQPSIFESASIIICVVPYLTMPKPPAALEKDCVALIVDEDPVLNITRDYLLALTDLKNERSGATTKELIRLGYSDIDTVKQMRMTAAKVVLDALHARKDAAAALFAYRDTFQGHITTGEHLLMAARAVVEQVRRAELEIEPNMAPERVAAILDAQGPRWDGITAERHFWRVIRDRMDELRLDGVEQGLHGSVSRDLRQKAEGGDPDAVKAADKFDATKPRSRARGATDARLQLRGHVTKDEAGAVTGSAYTHIRVSHRIKTSFQGVPALLLDASAQKPLVEKVFGREVVEVEVPAKLHLRIAACLDEVFSDASICPNTDDDADKIAKKEARVRKIRLMITKACAQYAPFRVLLVASQKVLEVLLYAWKVPANLDWMYFGNLRGLDGAKHHSCIVTVGRSQMPPEVIDAKKAAICFDDDEPEAAFDLLGTGYSVDGKPIRRPAQMRALRMRNGHDLSRAVPTMPTARGQQIEAAWRDEELRQAVGRLRPIHRDGLSVPPLWIAIGGSAIAEDFIIDEIFSLDDGIADAGAADARRLAGEIKSDRPALKLAAKREEHNAWHADVELRIKSIRAADDQIATMEVRRLAEEADTAAWRKQGWRYLGLPQTVMDLIDTPQALVAMGLDLADLDERAFLAWERAVSGASEPVAEMVVKIAAPAMTTPIEPIHAPALADDGSVILDDEEFEAFWRSG